jgi:methyltransferase (TIGR00027 family)
MVSGSMDDATSMAANGPVIRDIGDTARWAAVYRARETDRPNRLFDDPFARQLAGARGAEIAAAMPFSEQNEWAWITRTYLFDQFVTEQVHAGVDLIVDLGAGLDTRPYRLALPASLHWVELDLPAVLDYKEEVLATAHPRCRVERIPCDLSDGAARRNIFSRLGRPGGRVLILTEGVLVYLTEEEVGALASDLSAVAGFDHWVLELQSPGLLRMLQKRMGGPLQEAGVLPKFAPSAGPHFFEPSGWRPVVVRSFLKTAARLKRLSFQMRLMALLPESSGAQGSRPWAGVCLLERARDGQPAHAV